MVHWPPPTSSIMNHLARLRGEPASDSGSSADKEVPGEGEMVWAKPNETPVAGQWRNCADRFAQAGLLDHSSVPLERSSQAGANPASELPLARSSGPERIGCVCAKLATCRWRHRSMCTVSHWQPYENLASTRWRRFPHRGWSPEYRTVLLIFFILCATSNVPLSLDIRRRVVWVAFEL